MPEEIKAPVLSYEQIRRAADAFLSKHHPSRKLPIPIEEIVELLLAIHIVPLPGLQETFEIEAFTTSDRREIYVDDFVYKSRYRRYRFSLAHEVGHITLHKELYDASQFQSVREWKHFITEFPADEYTWFEYQAYSFAGGRNLLGSGDPGPERPRERASCGKDPRPSPTMLVTGF